MGPTMRPVRILERPARIALEPETLIPPAPMVDELLQVRRQLADLTKVERALTAQLVDAMTTLGLRESTGALAMAKLGTRETLTPDPALWLELAGPKATLALSVSVIKARELVSESDLRAISETTSTPVLRVEARP